MTRATTAMVVGIVESGSPIGGSMMQISDRAKPNSSANINATKNYREIGLVDLLFDLEYFRVLVECLL